MSYRGRDFRSFCLLSFGLGFFLLWAENLYALDYFKGFFEKKEKNEYSSVLSPVFSASSVQSTKVFVGIFAKKAQFIAPFQKSGAAVSSVTLELGESFGSSAEFVLGSGNPGWDSKNSRLYFLIKKEPGIFIVAAWSPLTQKWLEKPWVLKAFEEKDTKEKDPPSFSFYGTQLLYLRKNGLSGKTDVIRVQFVEGGVVSEVVLKIAGSDSITPSTPLKALSKDRFVLLAPMDLKKKVEAGFEGFEPGWILGVEGVLTSSSSSASRWVLEAFGPARSLVAAQRRQTMLSHGQLLYVLGGESSKGALETVYTADAFSYTGFESPVTAEHTLKHPRAGAFAVIVGSRIWVFGGSSSASSEGEALPAEFYDFEKSGEGWVESPEDGLHEIFQSPAGGFFDPGQGAFKKMFSEPSKKG